MAVEHPKTHLAAVIKGPEQIVVEERPWPKIEDEKDVVCKVKLSALCGSDLHQYRGHSTKVYDLIMGHEFIGEVVEIGSAVKNFKVGDRVVSPFTTSCGNCFYCQRGWTGRCAESKLYGSPLLPGTQGGAVRVPHADTTLYNAPDGVSDETLVLMCDIFPTGYFAAKNAWDMLHEDERKDAKVAVLGCGPVGLCAITAAVHFFGAGNVYAIDAVPDRLEEAKHHGGIPVNLNEDPKKALQEATGGRGVDAVLEIVGATDAFLLAFELIRNAGVISSVGLHTHSITMDGFALYSKNPRIQFGRCPARAMFPESLKLLQKVSGEGLFNHFVSHKVSITEAPEYYKLFNDRKIRKTLFIPA